jgi:peptidyl-prolyl cis-trans isomerase A (cyclophilin A)
MRDDRSHGRRARDQVRLPAATTLLPGLYFARAPVDAAAMTRLLSACAIACLVVSLSPAWSRADTTATRPKPSAATATAPAIYKVKLVTTKGDFVVEVHRDWAPLGADRFYNLVKLGFFADAAFFRVIKGFMVQLGIPSDPVVARQWESATIKDDPAGKKSNTRGTITFATSGPDMRTTQVFINYADNSRLDSMGFAPFGKVVDGMKVVDAIDGRYGEGAPDGKGPSQDRIQREGNAYLKTQFPKLDYIKSASIMP